MAEEEDVPPTYSIMDLLKKSVEGQKRASKRGSARAHAHGRTRKAG